MHAIALPSVMHFIPGHFVFGCDNYVMRCSINEDIIIIYIGNVLFGQDKFELSRPEHVLVCS